MKRMFIGTCVLAACAFAVAAGTAQAASATTASPVAAQEPVDPQEPTPPTEPSPAEPSPTEPSPMPEEGGELTLKGCLEEGEEAGTYTLTDVQPAEGGAPDAPAPGVPAEVPTGDITLKAASGVDLSAHVGHTIEVNGGWAEELEPGAESGVAEAGAVAAEQAFEAQSVEHISETCEGSY